jgi:hypothetical protein
LPSKLRKTVNPAIGSPVCRLVELEASFSSKWGLPSWSERAESMFVTLLLSPALLRRPGYFFGDDKRSATLRLVVFVRFREVWLSRGTSLAVQVGLVGL